MLLYLLHDADAADVAVLSHRSFGMFKFKLSRKQQHIHHRLRLYIHFLLSRTLATLARSLQSNGISGTKESFFLFDVVFLFFSLLRRRRLLFFFGLSHVDNRSAAAIWRHTKRWEEIFHISYMNYACIAHRESRVEIFIFMWDSLINTSANKLSGKSERERDDAASQVCRIWIRDEENI